MKTKWGHPFPLRQRNNPTKHCSNVKATNRLANWWRFGSLTKMPELLFVFLEKCLTLVLVHFCSLMLDIDDTLKQKGLKILAQNTAPLYVRFAMLFGKLALSKTSQLAPNTGLRLGSWTPSKLSLRRHSSSLCVSSVGQAWVRARSCSSDSELWTPKEHNWSCASASLQLETIEAFTQRCWLWQSDAMGQSQRFDDVGWFEVNGKQMTTVKK